MPRPAFSRSPAVRRYREVAGLGPREFGGFSERPAKSSSSIIFIDDWTPSAHPGGSDLSVEMPRRSTSSWSRWTASLATEDRVVIAASTCSTSSTPRCFLRGPLSHRKAQGFSVYAQKNPDDKKQTTYEVQQNTAKVPRGNRSTGRTSSSCASTAAHAPLATSQRASIFACRHHRDVGPDAASRPRPRARSGRHVVAPSINRSARRRSWPGTRPHSARLRAPSLHRAVPDLESLAARLSANLNLPEEDPPEDPRRTDATCPVLLAGPLAEPWSFGASPPPRPFR